MKHTERITRKEKEQNDFAWYKHKIDNFSENSHGSKNTNYKRMESNARLYNGILNKEDYKYVTNPISNLKDENGNPVREEDLPKAPGELRNYDIIHTKINAVLGMEMKRPFFAKAIAINPEASTEKEKEEFNQLLQFVIQPIMQKVQMQILQEELQQTQGQELTEEQVAEIQQRVQQEMQARTPKEVKQYMEREYQTPVEVMANQLLNYLKQECDLKSKFNRGFKHGLLTAREIYYIGELNGEPQLWNVNPLDFDFGKSRDEINIEDGEWATCYYYMKRDQVIKYFNSSLKESEIDAIYESTDIQHQHHNNFYFNESSNFSNSTDNYYDDEGIRVIHCVWKSLRKIGYLTYIDEFGQEQNNIVDETYKKADNDISLKWEWISEVYEGWKICADKDIYINMRPLPRQFKDANKLSEAKLPYYGILYDNLNALETCLMDRLKPMQLLFNITMFRLENSIAKDRGKTTLFDVSLIPPKISLPVFFSYLESLGITPINTKQIGNEKTDLNNNVRTLDMGQTADIIKYIQLAENLKRQVGESVGITAHLEGHVGEREAVRNVQQGIEQSLTVLEPYFTTHDKVIKNVTKGLLNMAKTIYSTTGEKKLQYIMDDVSVKYFKTDLNLLHTSTFGIFIANATETENTKRYLLELAHAGLQNRTISEEDIIKIRNADTISEMKEIFRVAKQESQERLMQQQREKQTHEKEIFQLQQKEKETEHQRELEKIQLKEEERRKTELLKKEIDVETKIEEMQKQKEMHTERIMFNKATEDKRNNSKEKIEQEKNKSKEKIEREKNKTKNEQKT